MSQVIEFKMKSEKVDNKNRVMGYMADIYTTRAGFEVRVQPTRDNRRFGGIQPAKKFENETEAHEYAKKEVERRVSKL